MKVTFCGSTAQPITGCQLHSHENWEIVLHLTGTVTSRIGAGSYDIVPGDILVIPPGVPHDGRSAGSYTDMFVQCSRLDFSEIRVLHDSEGAVLPLMQLLHKTFTKSGKNHRRIADSLLQALAGYLERYAGTAPGSRLVASLKDELYRGLALPDFSVAEAVARTGFAPDYVRRQFKQETGRTPLGYLTHMRMACARGLLQQPGLSVVQVAEQCGYADSFYFSRLFKQHCGLSPLRYRQQALGERVEESAVEN